MPEEPDVVKINQEGEREFDMPAKKSEFDASLLSFSLCASCL